MSETLQSRPSIALATNNLRRMQSSDRSGRRRALEPVTPAVTTTPVPPSTPRNFQEDRENPSAHWNGSRAAASSGEIELSARARDGEATGVGGAIEVPQAGPVEPIEGVGRPRPVAPAKGDRREGREGERGPGAAARRDLDELSRKLADLTATRDLLRSPASKRAHDAPLPDYMSQ